jgi:hypothetical protein
MQGLEWTLKENFFPWYAQLTAFQHCADAACVDEWSTRNGVDYDYLVVTIPAKDDESAAAKKLQSLAKSVSASGKYNLVYESKSELVFEIKK